MLRFIKCILFFASFFLMIQCKKAHENNPSQPILSHVLSHNDYEQPRPLLDALDARINYIEVDLALQNNELYATHTVEEIELHNTFEAVYLKPLRERIKRNGGFVYEKDTPFVLYINLKTGGETLHKINETLKKNKEMFMSFTQESKTQAPIYVIAGSPGAIKSTERFVIAEGNLETPKHFTSNEFYMVNLKWGKYFSWIGEGEFPLEEEQQLLRFIDDAHKQGRILRFWDNPDINSPNGIRFWDTILDLGVDILNTDHPKEIASYFENKNSRYPKPQILEYPQLINGKWAFHIKHKDPTAQIRYTIDGTEPHNNSPIYKAPVPFLEKVTIRTKAFWKKEDKLSESKEVNQTIEIPKLIPAVEATIKKGLIRDYFKGSPTDQTPNLKDLTPKQSEIVTTINHLDFIDDNLYALRYNGFVDLAEDGMYTFTSRAVESYNYIKLHNQVILENKGYKQKTVKIPLAKGLHPIQIIYYAGLNASYNLQIEGPNLKKQALPADLLAH